MGVASASFTLVNPFTASINMLEVSSTAQYHNFTLGTIDNVDISENPIRVEGHSTVTSPALPLKFNLDPLTIVEVITIAAQAKNIDLGPLVQMFQFIIDNPNYHPPVSSSYMSRTYLNTLALIGYHAGRHKSSHMYKVGHCYCHAGHYSPSPATADSNLIFQGPY